MELFFRRLLAGILTLLGFSSCSSDNEEIWEMYGCPTYTFEVKGTVTDANNRAVKNARIVTKNVTAGAENYGMPLTVFVPNETLVYNEADTVYSDANGEFYYFKLDYNTNQNKELRIVCLPPENSDLKSDSITVTPDFTHESTWQWLETADISFILK